MDTKTPLKIVITNAFTLNTGDAAILKGIMKIINSHLGNNVKYIIYDSQPKITKKYYQSLTTKKTLYFQTTSILRRPILRRIQNSKFFRAINRKRLQKGALLWEKRKYIMAFFFLTWSEIKTIKDYKIESVYAQNIIKN